MKFDGEIGLIQRKVADVPEGKARRDAIYQALDTQPGQSVLDIGCGAGHLVKKFALAVGSGGRSVGLDVSEEQLIAARNLCEGIAVSEIIQGDATNMQLADNTFDAVSSIQTLEYIPDVDGALNEIKRVVKPGGKIALISVLWDLWRFHGADTELTDMLLHTWKGHCPYQMLPFELPRKLATRGFNDIQQKPIAFINTQFNETQFAFWAAKLVVIFAASNGVDNKECDLWISQLKQADEQGRFGFGSVPVLTTAIS